METILEHNKILRIVLKKARDNGFVLQSNHFLTRNKETGKITGYETIIFDHKFAKALWPKWFDPDLPTRKYDKRQVGFRTIPEWKYHLQLMVLADDRLAYLKANT